MVGKEKRSVRVSIRENSFVVVTARAMAPATVMASVDETLYRLCSRLILSLCRIYIRFTYTISIVQSI